MKIEEIVGALERLASLLLQDGFGNTGLQIELTEAEAARALSCLNITEAVLDETIALGYNPVMSYHLLIFKDYRSIMGKDYVERCILKAIKNNIAIYSTHTNLDSAQGGVNYKIAGKIGLKNLKVFESKENSLIKPVAFVPGAQAGSACEALFAAGCGNIDNYDTYSYNLEGEGTFRAKGETRPFCRTIGGLHRKGGVRVETILPIYKKTEVIKALLSVHPYKEPAFGLYPLQNDQSQTGSGVVDELDESETELEFLKRIKKILEVGCVRHNKLIGREIQKITLCGGAGAFLLPQVIRMGADVFITGGIRYHDYFGHEGDILMAETGHHENE